MQNRLPTQRPVLDFEPVPRKYRVDGWTADRQRAFISALAATGSVKSAARSINMAPEGAYNLRRQPGAESFAHAWQVAVDHGVQSLTDIAIDRARDGVAVPIYWKGEQVGEKRRYNDRLLMFILRHHQPQIYGALAALPPGTRHPDTIGREAAMAEERAQAEAAERLEADETERKRVIEEMLKRYEMKVRSERRFRLEGRIVEADYTLRQLTHIELVLDIGDETLAMIDRATGYDPKTDRTEPEPVVGQVSLLLADIRQRAWKAVGDPPRPALPLHRSDAMESSISNGATYRDRTKARADAEARMAEAQAIWEAAASEETWQAWLGE